MIQTALPGLEPMLYGKRCSKCGETKSFTEYGKQGDQKDGLRSHCKMCRSDSSRIYNEARREEIAAYNRAYKEAHKEEMVAYSRAYRKENRAEIAARARAYRKSHKEEKAALNRAYRESHKEEIAARAHAYYETPRGRAVAFAACHRRRLLPGGQDITAAMIQEVLDASNGVCPYCGKSFKNGHIDHIIPVSKGGTNARDNLVYCCQRCNLSKGAKTLGHWLGGCGLTSGHRDHSPSHKTAFPC